MPDEYETRKPEEEKGSKYTFRNEVYDTWGNAPKVFRYDFSDAVKKLKSKLEEKYKHLIGILEGYVNKLKGYEPQHDMTGPPPWAREEQQQQPAPA